MVIRPPFILECGGFSFTPSSHSSSHIQSMKGSYEFCLQNIFLVCPCLSLNCQHFSPESPVSPRLCSLHPLLPLSYPFSTPKPGFLLKIKILFLYSHTLSPPRASHCTVDKLQKPLVCPTKPRSCYIRGTHQILTALGGSRCFSDKESERPPPHSPRALSQMLFSQRGLR